MFSAEQYHAKAAEYLELAAKTDSSNKVHEFRNLARSYTVLAGNEDRPAEIQGGRDHHGQRLPSSASILA
jgi:hypothetical protein